jgi:hypothetical protein
MAQPIIIVKEGSLTVQVRKRSGSVGSGSEVFTVTIPGDFKFPKNSKPKGTKSGKSWTITWKKDPPTLRRRRRR